MGKEKFDLCLDCGKMKETIRQKANPLCKSCAGKRRTASEETRKNMSTRAKDVMSRSEVRIKLSQSQKIHNCEQEIRKRKSEISRNCWVDPSYREKITKSIRERCSSADYRISQSISHGGDGDIVRIDRERRLRRSIREYHRSPGGEWSKAVKERDGNKCMHCGSTKRLHAHHIKQRASCPELSLVLENGITLCKGCHLEEHRRMREAIKNHSAD